ncbi:MAG: M48 family metallopeptidase [Planctomycetota bacterium]
MSNVGYDQNSYSERRRRPSVGFSGLKLRLLIGAVIVLFSVVNYWLKGQVNPVTGEKQRVNISIQEEIELGRQSVQSMGLPATNQRASFRVSRIGNELVYALDQYLSQQGKDVPYPFKFHLLADHGRNRGSVNAFALPGGQVFITEALYRRLSEQNDAELAGVLGHEIGHVLERHGAQRMAHSGMLSGIANAAGVAGGSMDSTQIAAAVGDLFSKKYGREDELESDRWGVRLMAMAGYDPNHLMTVMDVLEEAGAGGGVPDFLSTHPKPADRKRYIRDIIENEMQSGVRLQLR